MIKNIVLNTIDLVETEENKINSIQDLELDQEVKKISNMKTIKIN